jgi:hypothetical protein
MLEEVIEMKRIKLASAIEGEDFDKYSKWLEDVIFPIDFLEDRHFEAINVLCEINLEEYHSLMEAIIHNSAKANFSSKQLNDSIYECCSTMDLNKGCFYFNVNIHDNIGRDIESIGKYNLLKYESTPLFPLYYLLTENRALEGGTSYTGLFGRNMDWMLTFEYGNEIIIRIHGSKEFCNLVSSKLL